MLQASPIVCPSADSHEGELKMSADSPPPGRRRGHRVAGTPILNTSAKSVQPSLVSVVLCGALLGEVGLCSGSESLLRKSEDHDEYAHKDTYRGLDSA